MKVFVSWSGNLSQRVAGILRKYLPVMIQGLDTFMSQHDVESGSRWSVELARELDDSSFGILCLTPDNLESAWLLFEAGALTKHIEGRTCGLLLGSLRPTDVAGPLAQFQHRAFSKEDLHALLRDINKKLVRPLELVQLDLIYEKWWPDLERDYHAALKNVANEGQRTPRDSTDILEEMLERIRLIEKAIQPRVATRSYITIKDVLDDAFGVLTTQQRLVLSEIANANEAGKSVRIDQYSPEDLRDILATGAVRSSEDGELRIIHKTFAEYLAREPTIKV
jgi:hypothetical protein